MGREKDDRKTDPEGLTLHLSAADLRLLDKLVETINAEESPTPRATVTMVVRGLIRRDAQARGIDVMAYAEGEAP